jgi:geranylgeranyl pyrophosphate synthase
MQLLNNSESIHYAEILVSTHIERAISYLSDFPESDAKQLMLQITDYVIQRNR